MSIIAAKAGDYNNLRIVTFGSDGAVPYTDADGVVAYRSNRFANTYGEVNNSGFQSAGYWDGKHNTIIMRVRLLPGAVGMLFGTADYNISISGTSLTFKVGSDTKTISCTEGWHIIGFLDMADGIGLYYDGLVREDSEPVMFSTTFTMTKIFIGKGEDITGPNVLIAKVVTCEFRTDTDNKPMMMHYYPVTSSTPSATSCSWYETRYLQDLVTSSGTTTASGVAADYGISIDDIREVTGSGYDNILAIFADDGGVNKETGFTSDTAEDPYVTHGHDFAFDLGGVWIVDGYEASSNFAGYLKRGRKPLYNIFHDCIRNGFTVKNDPLHVTDLLTLKYNIFKTLDKADSPNLLWLDGYDTGYDNVHLPAVQVGSAVGGGIQFVDGLPYVCELSNIFINGGSQSTPDNPSRSLYLYTQSASGTVSAKLGNLAPWHFTGTELNESEWFVAGWAVLVNLMGDLPVISGVKTLTDAEVAAQGGKVYLSADTPDNIKTLYRDTLQEASGMVDMTRARFLYYALSKDATRQGTTPVWTKVMPDAGLVKFKLVRPSGRGQAYDNLRPLAGDTIAPDDLIASDFTADIAGRIKFGRYQVLDNQCNTEISFLSRSIYPSFTMFYPATAGDYILVSLYAGWDGSKPLYSTGMRFVAKLEMTWCNGIVDDNIPGPMGYRCELVTSRTYQEEVNAGRPHPIYNNTIGDDIGWQHWDGTRCISGEVGTQGHYHIGSSHNFDLYYNEFFDAPDLLPDLDTDDIPRNAMTKLTIWDAADAPITSVFIGGSYDTYNQTTMRFGSKSIFAYRPSLDLTDFTDGIAKWRLKFYYYKTGKYTEAEDYATFREGLQIRLTRIYYEAGTTTGGSPIMVRKTQVYTATLGSSTIYTLGNYTLNVNGQFVAVNELWKDPNSGGMFIGDPSFVEFKLTANSQYRQRGDTFILEFTN